MICIILIIFILFPSCNSLLKGLSDSLYQQEDVKLVEDGAPSYLLLVEGLIYSNPTNRDWLMTGIQLFSAYSNAFVKDEERKRIFLNKTKDWALKLLRTYSSFKRVENASYDDYQPWVKSLNKNDIPYVFWAANAWIMWIIANSSSTDAVIELPKAKLIIDRIYELDSSYYYGAPHLFYGIYYSILPEVAGGDLKKAKMEFDKAMEYSGDKFLMTKISYAEFYLKRIYNREDYIKILKEVSNTDINKYPEMRLLNTFSKKQAKELLEEVNNYFYNDDFKKK
jgi:hypothetical protein